MIALPINNKADLDMGVSLRGPLDHLTIKGSKTLLLRILIALEMLFRLPLDIKEIDK